jgi:hypothetical protein
MVNPRPLKLFNVALLQSLKNRYFGAKSIRSLKKVQILALEMTIFQKCGPRADLGWPWLIYTIVKRHSTALFFNIWFLRKMNTLTPPWNNQIKNPVMKTSH